MTRKKLSTPTQTFIAVVAALMLTLATISFQPNQGRHDQSGDKFEVGVTHIIFLADIDQISKITLKLVLSSWLVRLFGDP